MSVVPSLRRIAAAALAAAVLGGGCAAGESDSSMAAVEAKEAPPEAEPVLPQAEVGVEPPPPAAPGEEATVVHVVDGDTFDVEFPGGTIEWVRSPQIDAPEVDECGFAGSAAALEELILGETVHLVPTAHGPDRDSYSRLLRATELDGDDIGRHLIRAGLARWVPRYADEDPRLAATYEAAERHAHEQGAGFWAACSWS